MYTTPPLPCPPDEFHRRLYAGEILRLAGLAPLGEIVAFTRTFLEEELAPHPPTEIHHHLTLAQQVERFAALSGAYARSEEVKRLWRALFDAVGLDPEAIARDRLRLRFQPHRDAAEANLRPAGASTVAFHRDTWGTNLYAQVNWWMPVYPLAAGRTMALFPSLWSRPVRNSSADFDLGRVMARRKAGGGGAVGADDMIPHLEEEIAAELGIPVLIEPGTAIAFSSAHAHTGVGNQTGVTRISLETRTIAIADVTGGRGAPNLDGRAPWIAPGLFRRVSDGAPLHELLGMERLVPYRTAE
ncbi:MAG TPA: hypothetical protein VHD15_00560 [Hyphomicrobiales bacterium]|nr:hypothetical protein [Hyphomicrobiales bacterium]